MNQQELLIQIYHLGLILFRIIAVFLIAPIYGSQAVPKRLKLALALLIIFILYPQIPVAQIEWPQPLLKMFIYFVMEFIVGLIIGFIFSLAFTTIQLAGQFIDRRMGYALANVMNPSEGFQVPLVGQFKNIVATLIFLTVNGHHYILKLLDESFMMVPINQLSFSTGLAQSLMKIIGDIFPIAFKIALPIVSILFIIDLAFGLVARVVPQMNVFIMGMPTKSLVGLLMLSFVLGNYINFLEGFFTDTVQNLYNVLQVMGP
ncbi:flagellar biosynthetic protein FliR [Halanaerobacter jeridensis]|uniref:Flagellar biosynthetic protein FliR n=1 Tax=Halanaerobacter jeridensis TaxID=706427 RepID=A0A938XQB5_9FIRM|nr:flagellar biosynthetic protein FliR [Halanaerobacter jeridensis]MBM7555355.1 flagellar biosynthetic protein FliR [Halanaerobacter jeridensis]